MAVTFARAPADRPLPGPALPPMRALPLLLLLAAGCDSTVPDTAEVRVLNASALDFYAVEVTFTGPPHDLGPVAASDASAYEPFDTAYRYGYVRVETEAGERVLQPIDYVGEEPLAPGRYTFRLGIDDAAFTLTLVEDS